MDLWVLIVGLVMLAVALPVAGRRVFFLFRLITSGQPAPDRVENVTQRLGEAIRSQVVEVFGQRKLLKWSVPGAAHFFVFWAFVILGSVYLEAFGILFSRNPEWAIPLVGHWDVLGFAQDFIAVMCLVGLATFALIRLRNNPHTARPQVPVQRLAPRRRLAGPRDDLQRHLDDVPVPRRRRAAAPATCPTATARSPRTRVGTLLARTPRARSRPRGRRPAAAHRRDAGLPGDRAELQAPAHLRGAAQRALQAPARWRSARSSR